MKKLAWALTVIMLVTMFGVCGSAFGEAAEIDRSETVKFTYMYPLGDGFQVVDSMADNATIKRANEARNVEIEFIHPPAGQETEQYNLMLASDELPDLVTHGWGIPQTFPGGADKAINDGYYIDLSDLIAKYAPDFQKIMDEDENVRRVAKTDSGAVWGMCMVDRTVQPQWMGPTIRIDIFEKLGIEVPVTIEDWYNALTTIKNSAEYPDMVAPLIVDNSGHGEFYSFLGSWDIADNFCLDEAGNVIFGPATQAYKDYLTEMNKWYAEGLIQADFATFDGTERTKYFTTGKCAALASGGFWEFDSWAATTEDPEFKAYGAPYPQLVEGHKPQVAYIPSRGHLGYHTCVTTACENPERAVDWMNWFYTEEGSQLANWGVEGEDFTVQDDGSKLYTDKIAKNEEGVALPIIYFKYLYSHGAFLREWDRECPSYGEEANACMWRWIDSTESSRMIPSFISYTNEESDTITSIMNDINTYVGEMRVKFITGEESLDNFDAFVSQMENMGLNQALEIETTAYGRYMSR